MQEGFLQPLGAKYSTSIHLLKLKGLFLHGSAAGSGPEDTIHLSKYDLTDVARSSTSFLLEELNGLLPKGWLKSCEVTL